MKIPGQMSLNAQLHTPINTVMITLTSQLIILFTLLMMIAHLQSSQENRDYTYVTPDPVCGHILQQK